MQRATILLVLVGFSTGAPFPSELKKCNRKDANADQCYLEAAQLGLRKLVKPLPEANLPSFNPLEIAELKIGAGSQGVVNVDQHFKNCKLFGLPNAQFSVFNFDFDKKQVVMEGFVPEIKKICEYELNGKILVLPIVGTGVSTIVLNKIKARFVSTFEEVDRKNKTYLKFSNTKFEIYPEKVSFNFENLFNGDKKLGDNINQVLNDNQKDVFDDVKSGYENALGQLGEQILNTFFSKLTLQQAFD